MTMSPLPFTAALHLPNQRSTCRACGDRLLPGLSLGKIVPSTFLRPEDPDPPAQPLELMICAGCGLVQLQHTLDPNSLYRSYWYQSGINEIMRRELADVVGEGLAILGRQPKLVVDIGANDGTLLSQYPTGIKRIAFEPALNLQTKLAKHAEVVVPDFFPGPLEGRYGRIGLAPREKTGHWSDDYTTDQHGAEIITSIAMFYDLEDPTAFVREIDLALHKDGVWIVQFQDLAQMLQTHAFDNIGHEHLCYYSLGSFDQLLDGTDLHIVSAERREINGGSLRIYVRHKSQPVIDARRLAWVAGLEQGWTDQTALEKFAWQVGQIREQLQSVVTACVRQHGTVDLYAASTKAATLLQYCGLDHTVIRQAVERTTEKVGLVTSGTRIPIVNEHTWRMDPAPVVLIGAWQFAEAFMEREKEYTAGGGQWLLPLPQVRVVSEKMVLR